MKKIILMILISVFIFTPQNVFADELKLGCISGVLIDGDTGRVLYEKNCEEKRAMASTTKIMTCIVALEYCDFDEIVTISENAVRMPNVKMKVKKNEKYYLKDLLYALMLESYNDVAVAIAEHIGGSTKGFAKIMNKKAKELGMTHSHFVTPNGLDAKKHYSSALDMARLGAYAIKNKKFLKIINTKSHQIKEITNYRMTTVYNRDAFLAMDKDAIGIKTGFTNDAGYCFVGGIKNGNKTFVSCVLGSGWPPRKNQKYLDTKTLMNHGRKHYKTDQFKIHRYFRLRLNNGRKNMLIAEVEGNAKYLKSKHEKYRYDTKFSYELPIKKNQIIGYTKVYIDDFCLGSFDIKSNIDVPLYNFNYCIKELFSEMLFD